MNRVLITGGSGFIGSHLAERFTIEGYAVRVFDARPYPYPPPGNSFEAIVGDLSILAQVQEVIGDCQGIIHLGAVSRVRNGHEQPWHCISTNIMGTANVLEATRLSSRIPWVILGSTREVLAHSEKRNTFSNLYGVTKFSAEQCARRYAEDYGLRVLVLRFTDVYGSKRDTPDKVLPLFVRKARRSESIVVQDSLTQFDFIHYKDVVFGVLRASSYLEKQSDGIYDEITLCTGRALTLLQLAQTIVTELGSTSDIEVRASSITTQTQEFENDPSRAREVLGFQTQVSLRNGLKELVVMLPSDIDKRDSPIFPEKDLYHGR